MFLNSNVKFLGTYRPYQQRVLDNITHFLDNEKIHIVAAPGSGKTILGLELIKRLNNSSLVLVPSIAIREQWIDRFTNNFLLNKEEKDNWISNDIKIYKPIICITYQAFYAAYKKDQNKENYSEDDEEFEANDYNEFDLIGTLINYNIKTFCLDECHHLKNEWWKALENVINKIDDHKIIALTATPPYDSNTNEWQKYINLCGPIDEEIFVPELIKDKNLCPHHDYVYFSFPTEEEEKIILKSYGNGIKVFNKYKNDKELIDIVLSNKIYENYDKFKKAYYDNEEYYTAFILFLYENKIPVPFKIRLLVHNEELSINHFETLLQNVLFDDQHSFKEHPKITSMKKEFSALEVVNNRKVSIAHNDKINKVITMSTSKLNSIETIVKNESVNNNMKCLILTDYIKLKTKNYIGNENKQIDSFGTLPIFEHLRRTKIENVKLCCISGSVCIVPKSCIDYLSDKFSFSNLADEDYVEILIDHSNRKELVLAITKLLEDNQFNVLVGTKSLLGEGWDSPCINTLIMASFIGSYVSSNQMRGRAIRTYKKNLNKISNVWHLVTLNPFDYKYSFDYYKLQQRFQTFFGVDVKRKVIESGIERLNLPRIPYTHYEAEVYNNYSLQLSKNKQLIKDTWNYCINNSQKVEAISKVTIIPRRRLKKQWSFYSALINIFLGLLLLFINDNFLLSTQGLENAFLFKLIYYIFKVLFSTITLMSIVRTFTLINPEVKLYSIGRAILRSLVKTKQITSKNVKVVSKIQSFTTSYIYLKNATTHEQNLFSNSIKQFFGPVSQPRYLLCKPKNFIVKEYYVVPDAFKKNKELVTRLSNELIYCLGKTSIIFAKNDVGKNEVIKASKLYQFKFKNLDITSKNILLKNKRRKK